jgi:hypothetical protein
VEEDAGSAAVRRCVWTGGRRQGVSAAGRPLSRDYLPMRYGVFLPRMNTAVAARATRASGRELVLDGVNPGEAETTVGPW